MSDIIEDKIKTPKSIFKGDQAFLVNLHLHCNSTDSS